MTEQLNLGQLFDFVTQTLSEKREDLNAADTYNHDHGDHVVEVFEVVTQVAKENPGLEASEILDRASALLRQKQTGTAQAYAKTMAQGARRLEGQSVTQQTVPLLIEALLGTAPSSQQEQQQPGDDLLGGLMGALMGGGQQPAQPQQPQPGGDLLGGLMGALMGGEQEPAQPQQPQPGGDLLGGLLGALMGGGSQQQGGLSDGLDMGDMLRAGGAFLQASQSGQSTTEAALQALAAATGVGQTPHRAQSTSLVMQALLQAAQHMGGNG